MIHASLCSGIGSCELAAKWIGWDNAFSCEIDAFCQRVLKYYYPNSKQYGNIYKTDFSEWENRIDILTAGFPCQPFSLAGQRKGSVDNRYLWPEVLRVIGEVKPRWFVGENVVGINSMVLPGEEIKMESYKDVFDESYLQTNMYQQFVVERICQDLERIGYSIQPVIIPACAVGAPHRRDRIWFISNSERFGSNQIHEKIQSKQSSGMWIDRFSGQQYAPDSEMLRCEIPKEARARGIGFEDTYSCINWQNFPVESPVCCGNDGLSSQLSGITFSKHRIESIKAYGNSMVPQVVYQISKCIEEIENQSNF